MVEDVSQDIFISSPLGIVRETVDFKRHTVRRIFELAYNYSSLLIDMRTVFKIILNIFAENANIGKLPAVDQAFCVTHISPLFVYFKLFLFEIIGNKVDTCKAVGSFSVEELK